MQRCIKCNNKLGSRTIMKSIKICQKCRKLELKKCISCDSLVKWNQIRCKECQKKNWSILSSGNNNPMFNRTVYDIHKEKYGEEIANRLKIERYKKQKETRNRNGGMHGKRNGMFGKHFSDETIQRLKLSHLGSKNSMYKKSVFYFWVKKYGLEKASIMWKDKSKRQSKKITGELNGMYKNHFTKIWLEKYGSNEALQKRRKIFKCTKPEMKVKEILSLNNIEFTQQYFISYENKIYFYDFYLPQYNLLIEVDGSYWHGNPKFYEKLNETQNHAQKNDQIKNQIAKEKCFKLIRIWDSEIDTIWRII